MSRRYADPVAVRLAPTGCADDAVRPVAFRWRGRGYPVIAVLARWLEADAWWRGAVPASASAGRGSRRDGPGTAGMGERVLWRVEAGSGRRTGVYDLCCQLAPAKDPGRWFLVRALD